VKRVDKTLSTFVAYAALLTGQWQHHVSWSMAAPFLHA